MKTAQYAATTMSAAGVAILVHALMSDLWASLALHLPF